MTRRPIIIAVLLSAFAAFVGGTWFANKTASTMNDSTSASDLSNNLVRPHSPILGSKDASVTIVEFFDPACEACRAFHPIVKQTLKEHGDAVRVVIRYAPFHGEASEAAVRILEAARMQGLFESVLEALLREQPRWASHSGMRAELLLPIAQSAGFDVRAARDQMNTPQVDNTLRQDRDDIAAVGVRRTPTFFVNGKPLLEFGAQQFRKLVATEVASLRNK